MDNRQRRTVNSIDYVLWYVKEYPPEPTPPLLVKMSRELVASVARMKELEYRQAAAYRLKGPSVRNASRALRRDKLMPLVRIAKPLLRFAPGAERALQVPHARADALTVAKAAQDMAKMLKPHMKLLVAAGIPKQLLAELKEDARVLSESARRMEAARRELSRATMALAREMKEAKKRVTVIEGIVMFHHGKDRDKMNRWKDVRRVRSRMGRPRKRKKKEPMVS